MNLKILLGILFFIPMAQAKLEYDSTSNKVQIYGPYIKYNVFKPPYSLGRHQFSLDDIRLEVADSADEVETLQSQYQEQQKEQESEISFGENSKIFAVWPRFFMEFGELTLTSNKGRTIYSNTFIKEQTGKGEKFVRFELEGEDEDLLKALQDPFKMCLEQKFQFSYVKACSNSLVYKNGKFVSNFSGENAAASTLNNKRIPKNAQIALSTQMKSFDLMLKFKSGFYLNVKDKARHLDLKNIIIDPKEKRIGIISGDGAVRPRRLTLKDQFFSYIKENNYFRNQYDQSRDWPQNLENAEMEFAPYLTGASALLYGIVLEKAPPPFEFKLNDNAPVATYMPVVELKGTKAKKEVLAAKVKNELFIHDNQTEFLWRFPAPEKAAINQNYLSLQHKGKDYYFSKRIFRAHQTNVSASAALSTSPTLDFVPGYSFSADHWFEELWDNSRWSFQRWGVAANVYETIQGFKPKDDFPEKISVLPATFDLLFRFKPGVRPVESSFGIGVRYLNFKLYRSVSEDIDTQYLGIGGFWHTAPQKIIDDIFNIVPWFRYPKWMEVSLFYYPLLLGPQKIGFSFSWQARGKMFFARNWFLDASFNVNSISFQQFKIRGVTPGADSFGIATAHGTIGIGYLFN